MECESAEDLRTWTTYVIACMENRHLVTVFQLDTSGAANELDVAILQSLLQRKIMAVNCRNEIRTQHFFALRRNVLLPSSLQIFSVKTNM